MLRKAAVTAFGAAILLLLPSRAETVRDPARIEHFVRLSFAHAKVRRVSGDAWAKQLEGFPIRSFFRSDARYFEAASQPESDESVYAGDVEGQLPASHRRLVQVKVISSPMNPSGDRVYVALFNYTFLGVRHCNQCASLGKAALIHRGKRGWQVETVYFEEPNAGIGMASFVDLKGDGIPQLLVEVGGGVNAWEETSLYVFDIARGALHLLSKQSVGYDSTHSGFDWARYEKKLDLAKTRATRGSRLVFRVTTYTRDKKLLPIPEITEEAVPIEAATR